MGDIFLGSGKKMKYDCLVVGSGFAGSVLARGLAEEMGLQVLLMEKRRHIGGNMFDAYDSKGILFQHYGPHSFHSRNKRPVDYLNRFAKLQPYRLKCEAIIQGKSVHCPFHYGSIEALFPPAHAKTLIDRLSQCYPDLKEVSITELINHQDELIRHYGGYLLEQDYRPYSAKQWGVPLEEVDIDVLGRVPVRLCREEGYFTDQYQYQPKGGYFKLFERILTHPKITIVTDSDALKELEIREGRVFFQGDSDLLVVYTGPLDALFDYAEGILPYRSLQFEYDHYYIKSFQNAAVVAYPTDPKMTRITEYTKLPYQETEDVTLVAREYPLAFRPGVGLEPYYPIKNRENEKLASSYKEKAGRLGNLILCGRLAEYKYFNMDEIIDVALDKLEEIKKRGMFWMEGVSP